MRHDHLVFVGNCVPDLEPLWMGLLESELDMTEEQALEIMKKATKQNPAVGSGHQETVKTRAVREPERGLKAGWNSLTGDQIITGVAIALFAFLVWVAINFAAIQNVLRGG